MEISPEESNYNKPIQLIRRLGERAILFVKSMIIEEQQPAVITQQSDEVIGMSLAEFVDRIDTAKPHSI